MHWKPYVRFLARVSDRTVMKREKKVLGKWMKILMKQVHFESNCPQLIKHYDRVSKVLKDTFVLANKTIILHMFKI